MSTYESKANERIVKFHGQNSEGMESCSYVIKSSGDKIFQKFECSLSIFTEFIQIV